MHHGARLMLLLCAVYSELMRKFCTGLGINQRQVVDIPPATRRRHSTKEESQYMLGLTCTL
jgi:hypothetical protein